ncbi:MAG TPA: hypothetical protein VLT45_22495 [Kofleriaceae bacterium]|nr:hypothetical protein [Kofleriaceae bacterium]
MDPGSRRQLIAGLAASAILVLLAVLAAVASLHISTQTAATATADFERDLADVRAIRHAARDVRAAGRSYVVNGDRLALAGARVVLATATDRLHDARFAAVVRDARALEATVESSTKTTDHDVASFDTAVDRGTRTLETTSDVFIATAQARLGAKLDAVARSARRGELTAGVLLLVGLAALFGCVASFVRAVQWRVPASTAADEPKRPDPEVLT